MNEWVDYVICSVQHSSGQTSSQIQGWNALTPASEAIPYLQANDFIRNKLLETPKLPADRMVRRLECFPVPLLPNLGSPSKSQAASICCYSTPTTGRLFNSTSFLPSAPSPGPVLTCSFSGQGSTLLRLLFRKRPAPLKPLRVPGWVLQTRKLTLWI